MPSPISRSLASLVVQVVLIGFAAYLGFVPEAVPGSTLGARAALVVGLVVLSFLVGEVGRMRVHMAAILSVLQQAVSGGAPRDDRAAVDILVDQLATAEGDLRLKVHRHLVRLTGRDLPPDPVAWKEWWAGAREGYTGRGGRSPGSD